MSDAESAPIDLGDRASYDHWTRVTIRFGDEDRMGHVNNARYVEWLEASRVAYLVGLFTPDATLDIVLARITVDYRRETRWPGEVEVGARLLSVGNKSLRTGYGVFRDGECLTTCECINVFFDPRQRVSRAPPEAVRAALAAELARLAR